MTELDNREPMVQTAAGGRAFVHGGAFTLGGVLRLSLMIFRASPFLFYGLTVPFCLTSIFAKVLIKDPFVSRWGVRILNLTLLMLADGTMAYAAYQILSGERASFLASMKRSLDRLLSQIGIFCLLWCIVHLCHFVLVRLPIRLLGHPGLWVSVFLMLTIGVVMLWVFFTSLPILYAACVIDDLGSFESIKRSLALTKGRRWKIAVLYLLLLAGVFLALEVFAFILSFLPFRFHVRAFVMGLFLACPIALCFISQPVLYCCLRETKEGMAAGRVMKTS